MNRNFEPVRAAHLQPDASAAIQAAAALIALAMHESLPPVAGLGEALRRVLEHVGAPQGAQLDADALRRDLTVCVENLQFHDRLMQQLTQVRNLLASLAVQTLPAMADAQSWNVLVENIRSRFTSDSHRVLFNLLLPASGVAMAAPMRHASEGSIELF